ncbi:MAG: sugar transferase, partial [Methylomonas sp.]|nr:sugar transferase [Methylomonas sp.]
MNAKVSKAVILNKGTVSWFSKGSLHTHELPSLLNRGFLEFQIDALRSNDINEIHLVMVESDNGHEYDNTGLGLIVHRQNEFKGTAGAILPLKEALSNEPFIILNASTFVSEYKLNLILNEFEACGADWGGTFAVFESPCELQYSETIKVSKDSTIEGIYRSHRSQNRRSNTGLAGLYLLSPRCFEFIPENTFFDLKEQLLPLLINQGLHIRAHYLDDGCSVLTTGAYLRMQFRLLRESLEVNNSQIDWIQSATPELNGEPKIVGNVVFGNHCTVAKGVTIIGPVLFGNHCSIAENATIVGPTVIGNDCVFAANSWVQASVLHDAVHVGEHAQVRHCLLGVGHQVAAADTRNCLDALIDTSPEPQDQTMVNHEMPQTFHHYDMLANAYSIAKYQMKKRIFDILLASTLLALSFPAWLLIAIAIRLDSKGSIFYAQKRCGIHGKEFPMLKFRTMQQNAHQMQDALRDKLNEVDS